MIVACIIITVVFCLVGYALGLRKGIRISHKILSDAIEKEREAKKLFEESKYIIQHDSDSAKADVLRMFAGSAEWNSVTTTCNN